MEKILRYAIILLAGVLVIIFLYPIEKTRSPGSVPKGFYSKIDNTFASLIMLSFNKSAYYWRKDFHYRQECRANTNNSDIYCKHPFRYQLPYMLADGTLYKIERYFLANPGSGDSDFKGAVESIYSSCGKRDVFTCVADNPRIVEIGSLIYENYMLEQRRIIGVGTWFANIIAIIFAALLIFSRKWLAESIFNILKSSKDTIKDAAEKIHEKI